MDRGYLHFVQALFSEYGQVPVHIRMFLNVVIRMRV